MGEVIESRIWRHKLTGKQASPYGAAPWLSESDRSNWELQVRGWTIQHPDGTIGLGRAPFPTKAEAEAWVQAHPHFKGMQQD